MAELCLICSDELTIKNIVNPECGHSTCKKCFWKWTKQKNSCPFCRKSLLCDDDELKDIQHMKELLEHRTRIVRQVEEAYQENDELHRKKRELKRGIITLNDRINFKKQQRLFSELGMRFDHIKLIPPNMYNITPLYQISDLLITEASSTIYEMLALNKPIIVNRFYKLKLSHRIFRKRLYNARLNQFMENEISQFCFEAHSPKELPYMIKEALSNSSSKILHMEIYKKKM